MELTTMLVAGCLTVIAAASASRILKAPSSAASSARRSLRQAHRRGQGKYAEVMVQTEVARNAWTALSADAKLNRPVAVMLEIKMIERIHARANDVLEELRAISHGHSRMSVDELKRCQWKVWRQNAILNVCMSDVKESLARLRGLTSQMTGPYAFHSLAA